MKLTTEVGGSECQIENFKKLRVFTSLADENDFSFQVIRWSPDPAPFLILINPVSVGVVCGVLFSSGGCLGRFVCGCCFLLCVALLFVPSFAFAFISIVLCAVRVFLARHCAVRAVLVCALAHPLYALADTRQVSFYFFIFSVVGSVAIAKIEKTLICYFQTAILRSHIRCHISHYIYFYHS